MDSSGASIDFLLSAERDSAAVKPFFQKALRSPTQPTPRVIDVGKNSSYPPVVQQLKAEGVLRRRCRLRPVQYLNNVLEQDHWAIKRRVRASQGFRSFWRAYRTIQGYEAVHAIRNGQARWVGVGQLVRQLQFIAGLFHPAASSIQRNRVSCATAFKVATLPLI